METHVSIEANENIFCFRVFVWSLLFQQVVTYGINKQLYINELLAELPDVSLGLVNKVNPTHFFKCIQIGWQKQQSKFMLNTKMYNLCCIHLVTK